MGKNITKNKLLEIKNKLVEIEKKMNFKKNLEKDVKYYRQKSIDEHNYYSLAYCDVKNLWSYELYKSWDEYGEIPLDFGLLLKEIIKNDNMICIYIEQQL